MASFRVTYEGPSPLAVRAAALLADADGVELTASQPPQRQPGSETVVLALTVDGDEAAVRAAVRQVAASLPGATIDVSEA